MGEPARISVTVDCPCIEVLRGEYVTVWLRVDDGSGFDRIQCELRVEHDGTPRIFLSPRRFVAVDSFDNWSSDPSPSHPAAETLVGEDRPAPRQRKSASSEPVSVAAPSSREGGDEG